MKLLSHSFTCNFPKLMVHSLTTLNTEATLLEVLEYDLQEAICRTRSRCEKAEIAIAVKKSWGV